MENWVLGKNYCLTKVTGNLFNVSLIFLAGQACTYWNDKNSLKMADIQNKFTCGGDQLLEVTRWTGISVWIQRDGLQGWAVWWGVQRLCTTWQGPDLYFCFHSRMCERLPVHRSKYFPQVCLIPSTLISSYVWFCPYTGRNVRIEEISNSAVGRVDYLYCISSFQVAGKSYGHPCKLLWHFNCVKVEKNVK